MVYIPFAERLGSAPVGGGFAMDDYWVWCGSVIKGDDGRYHMYASRWPKKYPFFTGYKMCSEIVRAESVKPEGPYVFQEVVLPARGADYWDGRMTIIPRFTVGDTYLHFYIVSPIARVPDCGDITGERPVHRGFCMDGYRQICQVPGSGLTSLLTTRAGNGMQLWKNPLLACGYAAFCCTTVPTRHTAQVRRSPGQNPGTVFQR